MENGHQNCRPDQQLEGPGKNVAIKGHAENKKADVFAVHRIRDPEIGLVDEEQGALPPVTGSQADEQPKDGSRCQVDPAAVLMRPGLKPGNQFILRTEGSTAGRELVGDPEVDVQHEERHHRGDEDDQYPRKDQGGPHAGQT